MILKTKTLYHPYLVKNGQTPKASLVRIYYKWRKETINVKTTQITILMRRYILQMYKLILRYNNNLTISLQNKNIHQYYVLNLRICL